ncbi:NFX1-type zinc finger-containing protein, putative [Babesia ovis]|uniref:NFX1-type zinc finger-containing protein, putative n=1 Tax=Babesia ovis TaxID=5869 RepID=A0A9W5T912_BABOV|nr:NFX1-type zinc finger-containing protein, putative [Babesia ovis]
MVSSSITKLVDACDLAAALRNDRRGDDLTVSGSVLEALLPCDVFSTLSAALPLGGCILVGCGLCITLVLVVERAIGFKVLTTGERVDTVVLVAAPRRIGETIGDLRSIEFVDVCEAGTADCGLADRGKHAIMSPRSFVRDLTPRYSETILAYLSARSLALVI